MDDSKLILKKIDELSNKVDDLDSSLSARIDGLSDRVDGLNDKVDGLSDKFYGLNDKVDGLSDKFDGLNDKVDGLSDKFDGLSNDVNRIKLQIENEILPSISIIAEGHSILERKLDEALIMKTEHENMKLIITHHDTEIRNIKDKIGIA